MAFVSSDRKDGVDFDGGAARQVGDADGGAGMTPRAPNNSCIRSDAPLMTCGIR